MKNTGNLDILAQEFEDCQEVLAAIGDKTRQSIIITLISAGCEGMRVGEITKKTHLSRPAVSHHIKILRDAKVVNLNRQGTMNYYFLDPTKSAISLLKSLTEHIEEYMTDYWDIPK
ncbi:metalloregulator ArsR/SmtB family transcription factor [Bacillus safensis]|uniref:ArsR/SmtB family transcription factor n=1 Tax=Bacillus safensis TaxID=561879 RepID=UPI002DD45238|nr:metalloregulator ArsR/SmtB family transcription factor [Bacillus safensis]MEC4588285.1 metalloregulator ArsR/SmtB family transcription factor [Bacillus safensis]MEC4628948.1 metalloregulator ArsR/SmtB family transcription factor [Bacillus safensis]